MDVARLAKVSTATVSRVLNQNENVKPKLRKQVQDAIDALHYEPSGIARNMRTQSKRTIGLVIADIQNPFFTDTVRAIEEMAYDQQYTVLLGSSAAQQEKEQLYLNLLAQERIAGFIVVPLGENPSAYQFRRRLPLVFIDRAVEGVVADAVLLDNLRGGYLGTKHLLDLGHTRIGLVTAPAAHHVSVERQQGYEQALLEAGVAVHPELMRSGDEPKELGGYLATRQLLALSPRPTALFAVNNVRTLGMLRAIQELGLRIPDDISVVGFDDSQWLSLLSPPLTTIAQPVYEMGSEAFNLLMRRINQNAEYDPVVKRMPPTLLERASTARLSAG